MLLVLLPLVAMLPFGFRVSYGDYREWADAGVGGAAAAEDVWVVISAEAEALIEGGS